MWYQLMLSASNFKYIFTIILRKWFKKYRWKTINFVLLFHYSDQFWWKSTEAFKSHAPVFWTNVGLLLDHRLRRWSNINPALGHSPLFAGMSVFLLQILSKVLYIILWYVTKSRWLAFVSQTHWSHVFTAEQKRLEYNIGYRQEVRVVLPRMKLSNQAAATISSFISCC